MMTDRAIIANADSRRLPLGDGSVHMIATSPPYWGLRDYGTDGQLGLERIHDCLAWARGDEPCGTCYVCHLREWAREMWRVLRDDGVMFLNLGDSYNSIGHKKSHSGFGTTGLAGGKAQEHTPLRRENTAPGLKHKDLVGIPWRVALALQADGWYLRSDIIWAKPNPMPESVTDRPTKAHEYIFLLTKSARYFWDGEAVKEKSIRAGEIPGGGRPGTNAIEPRAAFYRPENSVKPVAEARNLRTVWNVATQPYSGAHFATWPEALVETMVKAGTPERGVCPVCGKAWERVVERKKYYTQWGGPSTKDAHKGIAQAQGFYRDGKPGAGSVATTTTGHRPACDHDAAPVPAIVLDPFAGSGTTLLVARRLGRIGLGFDLSLPYLRECAAERLGHNLLRQWGRGIRDNGNHATLPLFAMGVNNEL